MRLVGALLPNQWSLRRLPSLQILISKFQFSIMGKNLYRLLLPALEHTQAIRKYGLTRFHRRKFVASYLNNFAI